MAHNEAGAGGTARGGPGARCARAAACGSASAAPATARTTRSCALGEIAGQGAEDVVVALKASTTCGVGPPKGCSRPLPRGLAKVGVLDVPRTTPSWPASRRSSRPPRRRRARPHVPRRARRGRRLDPRHGGTVDDARAIRRKVVPPAASTSRGRDHRAVAADDDAARVAAAQLVESTRATPGSSSSWPAQDAAGEEQAAIAALRGGAGGRAKEPHRHRAQLQLASSLRIVGRPRRPRRSLPRCSAPPQTSVPAFRALVQADLGQERQAVADLIGHARGDVRRRHTVLPPGAARLRRRARPTSTDDPRDSEVPAGRRLTRRGADRARS